jgi:hypothetical protein
LAHGSTGSWLEGGVTERTYREKSIIPRCIHTLTLTFGWRKGLPTIQWGICFQKHLLKTSMWLLNEAKVCWESNKWIQVLKQTELGHDLRWFWEKSPLRYPTEPGKFAIVTFPCSLKSVTDIERLDKMRMKFMEFGGRSCGFVWITPYLSSNEDEDISEYKD